MRRRHDEDGDDRGLLASIGDEAREGSQAEHTASTYLRNSIAQLYQLGCINDTHSLTSGMGEAPILGLYWLVQLSSVESYGNVALASQHKQSSGCLAFEPTTIEGGRALTDLSFVDRSIAAL